MVRKAIESCAEQIHCSEWTLHSRGVDKKRQCADMALFWQRLKKRAKIVRLFLLDQAYKFYSLLFMPKSSKTLPAAVG